MFRKLEYILFNSPNAPLLLPNKSDPENSPFFRFPVGKAVPATEAFLFH